MPLFDYDTALVDYVNYSKTICNTWPTIKFKHLMEYVPSWLKKAHDYGEQNSHDPNTRVGAILIDIWGRTLGEGSNSLVPGLSGVNYHKTYEVRESLIEKPELKQYYTEHGERRAIFTSSFINHNSTLDSILICPYFACSDCARAIAFSGVKLVIGHKQAIEYGNPRWKDTIAAGRKILDASGVYYMEYDGVVDSTVKINGEMRTL